MTQKPPPARHRFRLKNPTQTPSSQTRNPVQPDAKPLPARQGKRSKRINRSAGRPLEAATTESNNEQSQPVYNPDDSARSHWPIVGLDGVCRRCGTPAERGVRCESATTSTGVKQSVELPDYAATQELKAAAQLHLSEYAYAERLPYAGSIEQ